jgi:hypothetical protein
MLEKSDLLVCVQLLQEAFKTNRNSIKNYTEKR